MRLDTRICRLEKNKGERGVLFAFIGVPPEEPEVFAAAQEFWDRERDKYSYHGVRCGLPWPSYPGTETKFLGVGTQDDLYFGLCGGVRDVEASRFVFLSDVAGLIRNNWKEVKTVMDTPKKDWDNLIVSEEVVKIMLCMVKG